MTAYPLRMSARRHVAPGTAWPIVHKLEIGKLDAGLDHCVDIAFSGRPDVSDMLAEGLGSAHPWIHRDAQHLDVGATQEARKSANVGFRQQLGDVVYQTVS